MKLSHLLLTTAIAIAAPAFATYAAEPAKPAISGDFIPKEQWEKMSPAEKEKIKAERRAKWEAMTPEEKEKRRAEMRERYKNASPAEQAKIRENMQERHEHMRAEWEKMSPEQRKEFEKTHPEFAKRMDERQKWEHMTPQERDKAKAEMKAHRDERQKDWVEKHQADKPADAKPSAGGQ